MALKCFSLLIVDRATTCRGEMIDKRLKANHDSDSARKAFIEYIPERVTSIAELCDVVINRPVRDNTSIIHSETNVLKALLLRKYWHCFHCSALVSCGGDRISAYDKVTSANRTVRFHC